MEEEILIKITELENHENDIVVRVKNPISGDTLLMGALRLLEVAIYTMNMELLYRSESEKDDRSMEKNV